MARAEAGGFLAGGFVEGEKVGGFVEVGMGECAVAVRLKAGRRPV
jgi:hypothetical protein